MSLETHSGSRELDKLYLRIAELEEENGHLKRQLALEMPLQARDILAAALAIPLGLAAVLAVLYDRYPKYTLRHVIQDIIPKAFWNQREDRDSNLVMVYISRLRAQFGRDIILNTFGAGYRMSDEMHARCRGLLEAADGPV